jgi:acyl-CoA hydrolase
MRFVGEGEVVAALGALPGAEPRVVVSGNFATPWELVSLLERAREEVRVFVLNPQAGWPRREGFITESPFLGPGVRGDERCDFLPMRLSLVPRLFETLRVPDAVLVHTSAPRGGRVSLGMEVNILPAAIEQVRARGGRVIAQVNPRMPYTRGDGEIPLDWVDLALEVDAELASPPARAADDVSQLIAERVARLCPDGATLQAGIGLVPDATLARLGERRGLGVWSEMISDGVMALEARGALDPEREIVATFLFGSSAFYEWAGANARLRMLRTERVNDPARIARQPAMLSINTALQVDLFAQSNASYVGHSIYSGFGGQPDFVSGSLHSRGGQAVIALRSWHDKSDTSTIVGRLDAPVCSFQHSVVVTEHGEARIFGRSQRAQARLLIDEAADPRARPALWRAAEELGLVRIGS